VAADCDEVGDGTFRIAFSGTGHHTIHCRAWSLPASYSRDVTVGEGEERVIELPDLSAGIRGAASGYDLEKSGHHGVARPRLLLRSTRPDGWHLLFSRPKPESPGSPEFEMSFLPPGSYHLFHHLVGAEITYWTTEWSHTFRDSFDAWGGVEVTLEERKVTTLTDFSLARPERVEILVLDGEGRGLPRASFQIRDPMRETWLASWRSRSGRRATTAGGALHPIPAPPRQRLDGRPFELDRLRAGPLEWQVVTDAGEVFEGVSLVQPPQPLRIRLATSAAEQELPRQPPTAVVERMPWARSGSWVDAPLRPEALGPQPAFVSYRSFVGVNPHGNPDQPAFLVREDFRFDGLWTAHEVLPTTRLELAVDGRPPVAFELEPSRREDFGGWRISWIHFAEIPRALLEELARSERVEVWVGGESGAGRRGMAGEKLREAAAELLQRLPPRKV